MPLPAEARFWIARALGLWRRGWASLRTRGLAASWARLLRQFRRAPIPAHALYAPAATAFSPFAVPTSPMPRASIIIPVYGAFPHTLACLRAIAAHPPTVAFEVIVVDDASPDDSLTQLRAIDGIRVHARASNGGFIAACNDGAVLARGELLVFLNNDTVPQPGWLDALLDTFEAQSDAGLVGAKLVYPDGRLQEAGGVVFADGSGWNYGRFEDPGDSRFNYLRDADYVSGAAIAIPRDLFARLGGFDARYAPAYYEDTDLAFKVRAAGLRVLYQPAAVVVHDEGTTSGTDINAGPKAAQVRNQATFTDTWRDALASQLPAGSIPTPALLHRRQRQVLVIDALTPQPDRDSGSLRLVNLMRLLMQEGAHVVFVPANRSADGAYTQALQALGVECWHAPSMARFPAWLREHGQRFDVAMVSRHYIASEMLPLLRKHAPQATLLFDTVDLHYLRERRAAELTGDATALRAAMRTRDLELALIRDAHATLVVSEVERELLAIDAPGTDVRVLSNLHREAVPGPAWSQREGLMFVGGFRHPPNVDAVQWFARGVFPLIRAARPALEFHCVGGDVPGEIARLAELPGVRIHGHVPDLQPLLDAVRVSIAPLRYGAGVKGKVNQAMAHGLPVVATTCAVEGMHLRDGEDVLVADDAAGFAEAVLRLHDDDALWSRLAANGRANVAAHFSLDAARDVVRDLFFD
ncbi:glycosyltransferase [Thermomonas carbonis]|uniref:Glycosyltransferase n=1 Tax=Thermomonas carbonis TaxID=1463158 RepID=A0A7G9SLS5_9GAMM|nr:glycosyltransferase [Thermomonas carbonis]QNN68800.1 glycosyltransferase [Thermomonas carbonis]GHC08662.1 glycosyl transferase family protein [Thermomonas carbonis]